MTNLQKYYTICSSVYPGGYEPLPEKEEILNSELAKNPVPVIHPAAYVSESVTYYKVEMPVHGFSKEDIFVTTDLNVLSVIAIKKPFLQSVFDKNRIPASGEKYLQQHIDLPDNVDPELAIAEYRDGVLIIFLYKYSPGKRGHSRPGKIAIY